MAMNLSRSKKTAEDEGEDWLVTYADAITLLLAFFVTTLEITKIDIDSEEVKGQIAEALGRKTIKNPVAQLEAIMNQIASDMNISTDIPIGRDRKGLVLTIPTNILFQPVSHILRGEAVPLLTEMQDLMVLSARATTYTVEVQAHAAPQTLPGPQYGGSRWDLTAQQASAIVRFFIYYDAENPGVPNPNPHNQILERFQPIGFSDTRPAAENVLNVDYSEEKLPAFENITDDRITIRIYPDTTRYRRFKNKTANRQ